MGTKIQSITFVDNVKKGKRHSKRQHTQKKGSRIKKSTVKRKTKKRNRSLKGGGTLIESSSWRDRAMKSIDLVPDDDNIADKLGLDPFPRPDCTIL